MISQAITNRADSQSLKIYLQEIRKIDLLTPEEEGELVKRIKQGDHAAFEQLTKANLRFVVSVAKQYQHQGLELSDLINEGNIGLIKAAQRFDETRGIKFISYAVRWIRQAILDSIQKNKNIVQRPLLKNRSIINNQFNRLLNQGHIPNATNILDSLKTTNPDIGAGDIEKYLSGYHQGRDRSLNSPMGSDDATEPIDLLPDPNNQTAIGLETVTKDTLEQIVTLLFSNSTPGDGTTNHTGQQMKYIKAKNEKLTEKNEKLEDTLRRYWGIRPYDVAQDPEDIADNLQLNRQTVKNKLKIIKKMMLRSLKQSSDFYNKELYTLLEDHGFFLKDRKNKRGR